MGRRLSGDFESRVRVVDQSNSSAYIDALGKQLAVHAPGERFPWQFKIIDDDTIDAFALPGGFIYVTRGLMQSLHSEPELAGILAHEIGHVVMRHGTQQISNAYRSRTSARGRVTVQTVMNDQYQCE
jgi:predicted Zn-dependent protease